MPLRVSVALCTYNGGAYLPAQLNSILEQSRLPDEVVVGDDGSTDDTRERIEAFRAGAPFPVHLLPPDGRLGSTKNFERVLRRCTGDLIALSDQDDRWKPQRLARSAELIEQQAAAALLFSDADLINDQGDPIAGSLWQRLGAQRFQLAQAPKHTLTQDHYRLLCRERFITGATVMLRRQALAHALPIPASWVHDAWLGIVLSFHGDLIALDEPLIEYRIHQAQQVGAARSRWQSPATRQSAAHWVRIHTERLQAEALEVQFRLHPPAVRAELLPLYDARLRFLRFRDALPIQRLARIAPMLRHWRQYGEQAGGAASGMKDCLLPRHSSLKIN